MKDIRHWIQHTNPKYLTIPKTQEDQDVVIFVRKIPDHWGFLWQVGEAYGHGETLSDAKEYAEGLALVTYGISIVKRDQNNG